jgi:hypothetical protein
MSISSHVAPSTSPERAAVRIANILGCGALRRRKRGHECGHVVIGHRRVMAARFSLRPRVRKYLVEVPFPARWVGLVLIDVAEGAGAAEDCLDACA